MSERLVAAVLLSRVSFSYQTAHTGYNLKMGGGGHLGSIGWCCLLQPSSVCLSVSLSLSLCHPILEASTSHLCRQGWIALCPSPSARPASTSFVSFVLSFVPLFVCFFRLFIRLFVFPSLDDKVKRARSSDGVCDRTDVEAKKESSVVDVALQPKKRNVIIKQIV